MKNKVPFLLIIITLLSTFIPAAARRMTDSSDMDLSTNDSIVQNVSTHNTDTLYCEFPLFQFDDSITLPVKRSELEKYENVLNSLPGVSISEDGYIYVKGDLKIKVSQILFRMMPCAVEFVCSKDYSVVYTLDSSKLKGVISRFVDNF